MKKIFMVSLMLLGLLMFNNNVKAACAGKRLAFENEEGLCLAWGCSTGCQDYIYTSHGIKNGTAYTKEVSRGEVIAVLDNYNGGSISHNGELVIELVGDNYITNEDGYGILSEFFNYDNPSDGEFPGISFIGNGTLTIKAKLPFIALRPNIHQNEISIEGDSVSTIKISVNNGIETINVIAIEKQAQDESNEKFEESKVEIKQEIKEENTEIKEEKQEENIEDNTNIEEEAREEIKDDSKVIDISKNDVLLFVSLGFSIVCLIIIIVLIKKNIKLKRLLIK